MVKIIDNNLYQCEECMLHYMEEKIAEDCEEFCRENNACNIEIIKYAIESKG